MPPVQKKCEPLPKATLCCNYWSWKPPTPTVPPFIRLKDYGRVAIPALIAVAWKRVTEGKEILRITYALQEPPTPLVPSPGSTTQPIPAPCGPTLCHFPLPPSAPFLFQSLATGPLDLSVPISVIPSSPHPLSSLFILTQSPVSPVHPTDLKSLVKTGDH